MEHWFVGQDENAAPSNNSLHVLLDRGDLQDTAFSPT